MSAQQERTDTFRAGIVTRVDRPLPSEPEPPKAPVPRKTLLWFGGAAGGITLIGLALLLVLVLTGESSPLRPRYSPAADAGPPLAKLCPPPTAEAGDPPTAQPPEPTGPRTVDTAAGISYRKYGDPWVDWRDYWAQGTLQIAYGVGQHFVTESQYNGLSDYHASILSGKVPATVNDSVSIDLACTGRQVAADVRAEYYPQPNRMELMRDEQTVLGGRPAWVTKFRLHFTQPGLRASSELAAVALIDVGRPEAAVLYVSIPDTHREFDWVTDDALASVRVLG